MLGYFLQGVAEGVEEGKENKIRMDALKMQKKMHDLKFKQLEAEEQWWAGQPEDIQKIRHLPKEIQLITMLSKGIMPLPGMGEQPTTQPQEWEGVPHKLPEEQPQQGLPSEMAEMGMRGMFKKILGIDPGERKYRTIAGEGGRPMETAFGPTGQILEQYPSPVKPESITFEKGGVKYEQDVNPYTRQPIGAPRIKAEKALPKQEKEENIKKAMTIIGEIESKADVLFKGDNLLNRVRKIGSFGWQRYAQSDPAVAEYESMISGTIPLIARRMGHTGVLTEQDVESTRKLFPQIFPVPDSETVARNKLNRIKKIISGKDLKTPPKLGGTKAQKALSDPLGIR